MKKVIASMIAVAGLAAAANAQATLRYEVRNATTNTGWSSNVDASPTDTVEVRVRAVYTGTTPVGGLAQVIFSPVMSNWQGAAFTGNGAAGDNVIVQTQGAVTNTIGPFGGTRTTPIGSVDANGSDYGRVTPFASASNSSTSYYRGFVGTGANAGLMRISQAHITNWIGAGATSGSNSINNVSGRGGVNTGQLAGSLRNTSDPAFNSGTDVVVFRFGLTLSNNTAVRTLNVNTPVAGLGKQLVGGVPGDADFLWYLDGTGTATTRTTQVALEGANINVVPAPAALALLGLGGLAAARRRR